MFVLLFAGCTGKAPSHQQDASVSCVVIPGASPTWHDGEPKPWSPGAFEDEVRCYDENGHLLSVDKG